MEPGVIQQLDTLYGSGQIVGRTGKVFNSLGALSTRSNLETIDSILREARPEHTLEIGLSFGGSATVFSWFHKSQSPSACRKHIALDPFQSSVWDDLGRLKLAEAGLAEYVEVIEQKSCIALPKLLDEKRRFGVIYIDGSHLFEDVFVDAYYCVRLLDDGGYLLFDDCSDPHVRKVLRFLDSSVPGVQRQPDPTFRQRVARAVGRRQLTIYRRIGEVEREWNAKFQEF
ncbi:MAG: class I SAM-dependent methyltransferase [Bryobacteraceae bacterium]